MGLITNLFGIQDVNNTPALKTAVEHAVSAVEPLLMQMGGYPERYQHPVSVALAYSRQLAISLPGPVRIDRDAYSSDAFVHALFPDINAISEAITASLAMQDYLRHAPAGSEFYALMGMRRVDKKLVGMELAGETVQRDVIQQATYFISHTIENPSPDERLAREKIATGFFHSLVAKVKQRIDQRRQSKEHLLTERNELMQRMRFANEADRSAAEARLNRLVEGLQPLIESLELDHYLEDFEAVLLHPEEYLRLSQSSITLDSMGIQRAADDLERGKELTLSQLIGYDRRDWTVTVVRSSSLEYETFAERLDKAYRALRI